MEQTGKLAPGMQIGDYLLKELISEGSATRTWYAQQVSVRREVIVDSLRRAIFQNDTVREAFLDDVRAKARVDHPLIGSVFEAVRLHDVCFYARERLAGETLERYVERGVKMAPGDIVHVLKQIAEANLYLERNNIGSIPIGPHQIYMGDKFLTRLVNMGIGEQRDHSVSTEDKVMLGGLFREILNREMPGATRVNSLCEFMLDRTRDIPITWEQIRDLSDKVEKQLRESKPTLAPGQEVQTMSLKDKDVMRNIAIAVGGTVVLLAFVGAIAWFVFAPKRTHARDTTLMVELGPAEVEVKGKLVKVPKFWMDAYEVTIDEYNDFLSDVEVDGVKEYAHQSMPKSVKNYYPQGSKKRWEEIYMAAKKGYSLDKRKMDVNQAITEINYWCALAYVNWKNSLPNLDEQGDYKLPSEAQWMVALKGEDISKLKAGDWMPVDKNENDVTSNKIHGLAGCVSEWSSQSDLNLDGQTRNQVILGASFIKKEKGALLRERAESRSVTRPDLGFRLIRTIE